MNCIPARAARSLMRFIRWNDSSASDWPLLTPEPEDEEKSPPEGLKYSPFELTNIPTPDMPELVSLGVLEMYEGATSFAASWVGTNASAPVIALFD